MSEAPAQVETACDAQGDLGKRPVHPWVCVAILLLAVALMAVTAEFVSICLQRITGLEVDRAQLVQSIDDVRNSSGIQTEYVFFRSSIASMQTTIG